MRINMNPNSELVQSIVSVPHLVQVPENLLEQAHEFQEANDDVYLCYQRSKDKIRGTQ